MERAENDVLTGKSKRTHYFCKLANISVKEF